MKTATNEVNDLADIELRLKEGLFQRILADIPFMVSIIDKNERIILANRIFNENFGQGENLEGELLIEAIPVKSLAEVVTRLRVSDAQKTIFEFNYHLGCREMLLATQIIRMQKNEILLILRDTVDERIKQEQLYLADQLNFIGQMASGIAHEINNPLTSILGLSELMLRESLPDNTKENLRIINTQALRTAAIVKDLLTFARKRAAFKEPVDLNSIINIVLKVRHYEQSLNGIEVDTQLAPLPEVFCDPTQLRQVFANIILNAEQAITEVHKRGRISIATQQIGKIVRITISDDGTGISRTNMQNLFTPFFTTKEVGKGRGLGLSMCHGIIAGHNGVIYARSEPGRGTTFIIELPVSSDSPDVHSRFGPALEINPTNGEMLIMATK